MKSFCEVLTEISIDSAPLEIGYNKKSLSGSPQYQSSAYSGQGTLSIVRNIAMTKGGRAFHQEAYTKVKRADTKHKGKIYFSE